MLLEMHTHTAEHSSCSSISARDLVWQVYRKGLQGVILTDHGYLWLDHEIKHLRVQSSVPDHFVILSAQEVHTADYGDVLVYGVTAAIEGSPSLDELRQDYPDAAIVWVHPYRQGKLPLEADLMNPGWDAVEILTSNHSIRENSRALQDWHYFKFTAIGGTDTHGESYAGLYPTHFDHPVRTIIDVVNEIKKGRCRPFFKEIPRSGANTEVTEVTIGTKGSDEYRQRLIIRSINDGKKWPAAQRGFYVMTGLYRHGFAAGPYRVPQPLDQDVRSMTLIEQGVRGKSLFEKIVAATEEDARKYLELAAGWLAKLHSLPIRLTAPDEFLEREHGRLERYKVRFHDANHPHAKRIEELADKLWDAETAIYRRCMPSLVQGHGDFHPKNVFIGQDSLENRDTLFAAAIDFETSFMMPPSYDVGTFLAQYRNQFFDSGVSLDRLPEEIFANAYAARSACAVVPFFWRDVEVFRARTNLSIAAYLVKLGLGDSAALWRVVVEAEQQLCRAEADEIQ